MTLIEAKCTRCTEIFIPHQLTPVDLIHGETNSGQDCGGIGVVQGQWVLDASLPPIDRTLGETRGILEQEMHGMLHPLCDDPDCEFHYPEGIVLEHNAGDR